MTARMLLRMVFIVTLLVTPVFAVADVLNDLLGSESATTQNTVQEKIELESDARSDNEISKRLVGIFTELDTLESVNVAVVNGIVTLSGTVPTARGSERATRIAGQVKGVIEVVDTLTVDTNVSRRVDSILDRLQLSALSFIAALPIFLLSLVLMAIFWWAGRRVGQHRRVFNAVAPNGFIADLLATLVRIIVTLAGLVLALSLLDATSVLGSVLGAAGIVGLAVGFAVRDTVENFIASILLSLRAPFLVRDYVQIGEHEGSVARLTSRATILISRDGNHVRVPNAIVYKSIIINFTRQPDRRFEFVVGIDTDLDLNAAQKTAVEAVYAIEGVLPHPPVIALVTELGDSSVTLTIGGWIDQTRSDLMKVRSEAIRQVKQAFDDAGIVMPEPIYQLRFRGLDAQTMASQLSSGDSRLLESLRKDKPPLIRGSANAAGSESGDTAVDESIRQSIDRELSASGSQNLLNGSVKTE
ncbi:mechanosensitive ion channel domain-containing protein [Granulosicoccus antarcticus]|uniref:Small-conductance mechanosensitive channel n=1 Tax=Granulosicoccus antarcticus IMCC3135 TaxID=1192854 RepID=A0A2Z2NM03_9GAMM|nr:mechanosensitive ion channel domain-containing protein [Granulosicoccus antarcticus]ASJ71575.1 Small-conductance mechanosensitive channel [Granulosicoccus antarcticus IMCC3135]